MGWCGSYWSYIRITAIRTFKHFLYFQSHGVLYGKKSFFRKNWHTLYTRDFAPIVYHLFQALEYHFFTILILVIFLMFTKYGQIIQLFVFFSNSRLNIWLKTVGILFTCNLSIYLSIYLSIRNMHMYIHTHTHTHIYYIYIYIYIYIILNKWNWH